MIDIIDISALFTVFLVGLLGSGHCFGMCGGIAAGLGTLPVQGPTQAGSIRPRASSVIFFNLGRILSYACLGIFSAWLLASAGEILNVPRWSMILRFVTALMIFLIGVQFLFNWQVLGFIERAGAHVWKRILPVATRAASLPGGSGRLLLGLCWGFLPCGLVYSVVLTASASGSPLSGALVMLAFGLGTVPSMLGMGLAAPALAAFLNDRWTRRLMGAALIFLAVLSVTVMTIKTQGTDGHQHMHGSLNSIIQITANNTDIA
jgi:sulfite exporter TauE/SafE